MRGFMQKPKKAEALLLKRITSSAHKLQQEQRGLEIGQLIALIRSQLSMSQRVLAKRAKVPQATISKIESKNLRPNVFILEKILNAMKCDLLITGIPRESLEIIRKNQAREKAKRKIQYLQGTMSLEEQEPDQEFLQELIDDEARRLLNSSSVKLWEEEL